MARRLAIDTVVLSHAVGLTRVGVSSEWRARAQASNQLLSRHDDICVPAPVLAEALRTAPAAEALALMKLAERMRTLSVTALSSVLSSRLLAGNDTAATSCPKCHEPLGKKSCSLCGRIRGPGGLFADALIAGCVLSQPGDWTLFTYNVKDFETMLAGESRVTVMEPPPYASGAPLLDYLDSQPLAVESKSAGDSGSSK